MDDSNNAIRGAIHTPCAWSTSTWRYQRHRLLFAARTDEAEGHAGTI